MGGKWGVHMVWTLARIFYRLFHVLFVPHGNYFIRSRELHMLVFALQLSSCTAIGFLITKRHCYDDQPISTPNFKLYLLGAYPVGVTELYKFFFMQITSRAFIKFIQNLVWEFSFICCLSLLNFELIEWGFLVL